MFENLDASGRGAGELWMVMSTGNVAGRLDEIVAEFADLEPRERLELLLDFANNLPPLPEHYQRLRDAGVNRVHECQTPVYLWVVLDGGRLKLYAEVAEEAPTVKGFVAILVEAFQDATPQDVLAVPPNLLARLGLIEALGMMRMQGLNAIVHRIRNEVKRAGDV